MRVVGVCGFVIGRAGERAALKKLVRFGKER